MRITVEDLRAEGPRKACEEGVEAFVEWTGGTGVFEASEWTLEHQIDFLRGPMRKWWGWAIIVGWLPAWAMRGANLRGADLSGANLRWADLSEADLSGAKLSWAKLSGAKLSEANLREADLSGAKLSWANLSGADLSWANLRWADLSEADLREANMSGADLSGADLSEADLGGARHSVATKWPTGFDAKAATGRDPEDDAQ